MGEDCLIPICTYGCSNGKCIGPNVCQCEAGWYGSRCEQCKPTSECKNPYYDNRAKKCQCPNFRVGISDTLADDLSRLDREYGRKLEATNSTYLTLSVLIIILLIICALLLMLIIGLILRNSNFKWPCFMTQKRKTQPATESVPNIIDL